MGHNIEYYEYPESVDKNKVYSELGNMVYYRCIQEGGRLSAIRWLESSAPILNGRDAAEEYIKAHDKGWYDCLAVRFHPQSTKESEREKNAKIKFNQLNHRLEESFFTPHFQSTKAEFIGCKGCGSRISKTHLLAKGRAAANKCPVCGCDMRPQTVLAKEEKIREDMQKCREAIIKEQEKRPFLREVCWLVKIEYHT